MPKYCKYCEEKRKTRTDGSHLYCAVCGSGLGPARGDVRMQF